MLRSLIRILRASLVQIDTEMTKKYAKRYPDNNNQRSVVSSHSEDMAQSALMGAWCPRPLTFWPWNWLRVASKVGNLHSEFEHARPLGSGVIRYVRDGLTDGQTDGRTKATLIALEVLLKITTNRHSRTPSLGQQSFLYTNASESNCKICLVTNDFTS